MTRTLTLKNCSHGNSTIIENDFIDNHMAKANGEYIKIYLLLLRHLQDPGSALSISGLADCLECTEKDVLRAFKHWSKEGLLQIHYDESGNICGLAIGKDVEKPEVKKTPTKAKSASKQASSSLQEDLRQLYFIAEQYLGKPLSVAEIRRINFFFDSLGFSVDLIEYLIEYCVENGHRNFNYIESVALAWSDNGVQTVEAAKLESSAYSKTHFSILNALGIKGRSPAPVELEYIKKWTEQYGFELEIILEACNRTISNTHKPDFKYADTILTNWNQCQVHSLEDIARLDLEYRQGKGTKKRPAKTTPSGNKFNNFEGRSYDISSLEQQLLNSDS